MKQIEIRPKDPWAHTNLGRAYLMTKQYDKAISELEISISITPDDASIYFLLGRAQVKANQREKAAQAFEKSAELQPVPFRWNDVAYELSEEKLDLPLAKKYSQNAIAATVLQMRDTSVDQVSKEEASLATRIASFWDTWGWVRFQEGELKEAERYVRSSWIIRSNSVISDHLGQIYQQQGRKAEAILMYEMALATDGAAAETRDRLAALAGKDANIDEMTEEGRRLLKDSHTTTVKNSHHVEGFAEFWILLSPGPTVRGIKFINGDEELKPFEKDLEAVSYPDPFPEATEMRLLRRSRLSCTSSSPDCRLLMVPSQNVPTEELRSSTPSVAGAVGRVGLSGSVAAGRLLKKVQPDYPAAARQARIEGTVRMHAIIGKDGYVKELEIMSGHPLMMEAALEAVRQWQYQPTTLEGRPVEVDTEIDVVFQLTRSN